MTSKRPGVRCNQAVLLVAGALFLVFIVAPDDDRFYWTPLTIGVAYLGAAIAGGRDGGHWATACALIGWGAAVVLAGAARPDLDVSGLYLAGAGLDDARTYAALLGAVALANVTLALLPQLQRPRERPPTASAHDTNDGNLGSAGRL